MSSNSFFASAPTVVLPPAPDQYFVGSHYASHGNGPAPVINGISPNGLSNSRPFAPKVSPPATTPGSIAGRKRSRGDINSAVDEEDERLEDGSVPTSFTQEVKKPRGKHVYGPGMPVSYPEDPSYAMTAESQSGTLMEEDSTKGPFTLTHAKRPSVTSRKSQRTNSSAATSADDLAQLVLPSNMREVTTEPLIDEATRSLGISWKRMDSTEVLRIHQKAYAKWIQNYYPGLKEVAIWFENSAIPGYLVSALNAYNNQREYYIFSNDLTEARLVTSDPSQLLPRLSMLPALHLAAPGGCLRAETDPITASQNEVEAVIVNGTTHDSQPSGACAAHAMELD